MKKKKKSWTVQGFLYFIPGQSKMDPKVGPSKKSLRNFKKIKNIKNVQNRLNCKKNSKNRYFINF